MPKEPTADVLLNRFCREIQSIIYPFLVLSIIDRKGSASREEISEEIFALSGGVIANDLTGHNRLMGRLEKTFGLIVPMGKDKSLAPYELTEKGKRLYTESLERIIYPLGDVLPTR